MAIAPPEGVRLRQPKDTRADFDDARVTAAEAVADEAGNRGGVRVHTDRARRAVQIEAVLEIQGCGGTCRVQH
jgi:hypothetical protein